MTTVNIAIEDYNIFVANTLNEGAQLYRSRDALGLESFSTTSYASISNEGFIDWVKDKLRKIGQRFVIVVNKVIARFSKNRAALEANIAKYKENPQAEVELAVSPKTLKRIAMTIGVVAAAIVAMFMCIPNKDGKSRIAQIFSKTKNTVAETKAEVKKDEAQGPHVVKAAEAGAATVATVNADKKTESTLNAAKGKVASAGNGGGDEGTVKEKLGNVARATSNTLELAKSTAGLTAAASKSRVKTNAQTNQPKDKNEGVKNAENTKYKQECMSSIVNDLRVLEKAEQTKAVKAAIVNIKKIRDKLSSLSEKLPNFRTSADTLQTEARNAKTGALHNGSSGPTEEMVRKSKEDQSSRGAGARIRALRPYAIIRLFDVDDDDVNSVKREKGLAEEKIKEWTENFEKGREKFATDADAAKTRSEADRIEEAAKKMHTAYINACEAKAKALRKVVDRAEKSSGKKKKR